MIRVKRLEDGMPFGKVKTSMLVDFTMMMEKKLEIGLNYLRIIGSNISIKYK